MEPKIIIYNNVNLNHNHNLMINFHKTNIHNNNNKIHGKDNHLFHHNI